jgi:hypothetical protein
MHSTTPGAVQGGGALANSAALDPAACGGRSLHPS